MSINKSFLAPRREEAIKKLRTKLSDYFIAKGISTNKRYPYILDTREHWHNNIIEVRVLDYITNLKAEKENQREPFPLHKYLHHGLSSQAFLFNLLGPVVADKRFDVIDEIVNSAGVALDGKVSTINFELEDRSVFRENQGQPTSVDIAAETDTGERIYAEFKFTEAEFGGCSLFVNGDCDGRNPAANFKMCYLHCIGRQYWNVMSKFNLITSEVLKESRCPFTDLYQAYRLIMFALDKGGHFILIYDERNPAFYVKTPNGLTRGVFARFLEYLPQEVRDKCHLVSTQKIFDILKRNIREQWVENLQAKYF